MGSASAPVTAFTIVADDLKWDLDRIVVPVGQEVTATIDNRDEGIDHNFHVRATGDPKTAVEEGPVTQTLTFTIAETGEFEYLCDIHPFMEGTLQAV